MPTNKKVETVQNLKEMLDKSKLTLLTDYRGLKMTDLDSLRKELRSVDAEYIITKNTLILRALKDGGKESLVPAEALEGPTATLFAYGDEVTPVKALQKAIKALGLPVVKTAILGGDALTVSQVETLGRLPSREVLIGQVVGGISSPLYGIVNALAGNIRNLVNVLNAVSANKTEQ